MLDCIHKVTFTGQRTQTKLRTHAKEKYKDDRGCSRCHTLAASGAHRTYHLHIFFHQVRIRREIISERSGSTGTF